LTEKVTVKEFEHIYLDAFKEETAELSEETYELLNWLFSEIDCYTDMPLEHGENPNFHVTEAQLRESAKKTLAELEKLGSQ
jgi:hypothetical protein